MSNVFESISSGVGKLKNYYEGPIKTQFNDDCPIYRGAQQGKIPWSGAAVKRPLKVRRNQGIGSNSDGGTLASIGTQTVVQAEIAAKFNWLRFGLTAGMIEATKSDKGSFAREFAFNLEQGYSDFISDINRQASWNGNGRLAKLNAAAVSSASITVVGREGTNEDGNKFLDVGMVVDIVDSSGTIKASGVTINAISTSGGVATLTLSATVTAANGDFLVRNLVGTSTDIQGILTALDGATSTIYGIDRSTYPAYQGNVVNAASGQLTLDLLKQAWNLGLRRGGAKYNAVYSDFDSQRYYEKLLVANKRFINTVKGDGAFADKDKNYTEYAGIPWVADKDCPVRIFFLDKDAIECYELAAMKFADESGAPYIVQTGTDAFEVRIRCFMNLFNSKPSACAVLHTYVSP